MNTAIRFSQLSPSQRTLGSGLVLDPVGVVARSLKDRKDGTFYYPELRARNIGVIRIGNSRISRAIWEPLRSGPLWRFWASCPWSTAEAVIS